MINSQEVFSQSTRIYKIKYKGFVYLLNPYTYKGLCGLLAKEMRLFSAIDGRKPFRWYVIHNKLYGFDTNEIAALFKLFIKHNLLVSANRNLPAHPVKVQEENSELRLWVQLTNQCNFRCTYCYVNKSSGKMSENTANLFFKKLILINKKYRYKKIILNLHGGEPLLNFTLIKTFVKKAKKLSSKDCLIRIFIVTNGSLLTEEKALYLKKENIGIGISLDGYGKYNDITRKLPNGGNTYNLINKGLIIAKKYHILSHVLITVTNKNIVHLKKLIVYLLERGIYFSFSFYNKANQFCYEESVYHSEQFVNSYKSILRTIYNYYQKYKLSESPLKDSALLDGVDFGSSEALPYHCFAGIRYFTLSVDGKIKTCPMSLIDTSSIYDRDFIKETQNKEYDFHRKSSVENMSSCDVCPWKYMCRGRCRLERLFVNKDVTKPMVGKCLIMKELIPYMLDLETQRLTNIFFSKIGKSKNRSVNKK